MPMSQKEAIVVFSDKAEAMRNKYKYEQIYEPVNADDDGFYKMTSVYLFPANRRGARSNLE